MALGTCTVDDVALAVCTTVNLARELHVVEGGEVTGRWEVAAAGANR